MKSCSQCNTPIANDSPEGLCARCLLGVAIGDSRGSTGQDAEIETVAAPEHASAPASRGDAVTTDSPRENAGTTVGNYKLLQLIGEGGFGSVFMAEQQRPVRRRVALKIIKLGMDTKQVIARFEAERQALAIMDHPNIAKVFDAGATASGRPYFVMELVRGIPITEYCDVNRPTTSQRLELFVAVCQAIQHAHQKGVIHRDIKPSNVLVTFHDGVPVPKVIDFGIAKATNSRLTEKTLFTEFRQFIGTPAYVSPEQAEMSGLDIDTRSDIYSLGVLLYELLTGTTPFDSKCEALRIRRAALPPGHPDLTQSIGNLAFFLQAHDRAAEAEPLCRELLKISREGSPPNAMEIARAAFFLGTALSRQGKYIDAEPLLREALTTWQKELGPERPETTAAAAALAGLLDQTARADDAKAIRKSIGIGASTTQPTHNKASGGVLTTKP